MLRRASDAERSSGALCPSKVVVSRSTNKRQQTRDLQSVRGDDEDDPDFWPAGDARASTDALVNGGVFAFLLHGPFANEERPNRWMSVSLKNAPNSDSRR